MSAEEIAQRFPGWRPWQGVAGMCYASRRVGVDVFTLRGHNWAALEARLEQAESVLRRKP